MKVPSQFILNTYIMFYTLYLLQQIVKHKYFYNCSYARPVNSMISHNVRGVVIK